MTLSDLARAAELPRATARRILFTLERGGFVASDGKLFTTRAGYHHLDVLTAARTQNNGKPEIVSTSLVDAAGRTAG